MRWAAAAGGLLFALAAGPYPSAPGLKCRVCEDAVQTWHDQFPCLGNSAWLPGPLSPGVEGCLKPLFSCGRLHGRLQEACLSVATTLRSDSKAAQIWTSLKKGGDAYATCYDLKMCAERDAGESLAKCHAAFEEEACIDDIYCKAFPTQCEDGCYLCTWLLKSWPVFQEACRPAAIVDPKAGDQEYEPEGVNVYRHANAQGKYDELPPPPKKAPPPRRFLELESARRWALQQTPAMRHAVANLEQFRRTGIMPFKPIIAANRTGKWGQRRFYPGVPVPRRLHLGAVALNYREKYGMIGHRGQAHKDASLLEVRAGAEKSYVKEYDKSGASSGMCYAMWSALWRSRKARYLMSWNREANAIYDVQDALHGRAWDANTVCKCLGMCALGPFEDLGLIRACEYNSRDQARMEYLWDNEDLASLF